LSNEDIEQTQNEDKPQDEKPQAQPQGRGRQRKESSPLAEIFELIAAEVAAQDEKWGEQNHPANGGRNAESGRAYAQRQADAWKGFNAGRVDDDTIGWDGILYEEAFEAFAEEDPQAREAELVQTAAVVVNAILSLRRTGA
jgi:hypothetical protein